MTYARLVYYDDCQCHLRNQHENKARVTQFKGFINNQEINKSYCSKSYLYIMGSGLIK